MTAAAILDALAEEIRTNWAPQHNCRVQVAPDPVRALELLRAGAPDGCSLAAWFAGESPADDAGLVCDEQVAGRFSLALAVHPGLKLRDGRGTPGALGEAESLRRFLLRDASGEGLLDGWRYAGMESFQLPQGDAPLGGYTLTLSGIYDCGDEETENNED